MRFPRNPEDHVTLVWPRVREQARAALREPLLHFLVLGAAIYGAYALAAPDVEQEAGDRITVTRGEVDWLTAGWEKRWGRSPTPGERSGLIEQYVRETIFYREALAMGLDRDDTIVRRRLAQKLEFLALDLIQPAAPSEDELRSYFESHLDRYRPPDVTSFTHIFFDPDRREDDTLVDAEAVLAELRASPGAPEDSGGLGDAFLLQRYYPERSELEVSKLFGREFARSVFELEPERWHGPVLSGYGVHLVYVHGRTVAPTPEFADVAERVREDWEGERRDALSEEFVEELIGRYEVIVEDVAAGPPAESADLADATP